MGIKGLAKLLSDEAPGCIKEVPLSSLQGRKVAIDASMAIYQFLIAVRTANNNNAAAMLTNAQGEATSHIQGFFNRTIRFMTEGIRPVYVFDGTPPEIKSHELSKRRERVKQAEEALKTAQEQGDVEEQDKQSKRLVRAGHREKEDCIKLLGLMGVPIVRAPAEAEAQCADMNRRGLVWAVATEDMDALTFRSSILLRKMTFATSSSPGNKGEIQQMDYEKVISGLGLTHAEFVDLCILLGCDYCDSIRGVGPKTALKLIREHHSIENILQHLDKTKYGVPESWMPPSTSQEEQSSEEPFVPIYVEARRLFNEHEVLTDIDLKWNPCQPEPLTTFLVDEMGFSADRVKSSIEKLQKAYAATAKPQMRMDSFFKPVASTAATTATSNNKDDIKRKGAPAASSKDDKSSKKTKNTNTSSKGGPKKR